MQNQTDDYTRSSPRSWTAGVPEWRFRWEGDGTPEGSPEILGLNATRDEFLSWT